MKLEQRLRDIRVEQGLSQETLAERVNVSRQTVSKWENGAVRPSADNLAALSQVFGLPADAFLKDDWVPPEQAEPVVVEVPVPAPRNYRLWALLAAALIAAGVMVGVMFFREQPDEESVSMGEIGGETVEVMPGETIPLLPPEDSNS